MADEQRYALGIDAGTAGMRAGLFDLRGQPLGFAEQVYPIAAPLPGCAEQQPEDWWQALVTSVQQCLARTPIDPAHVIGLAIDAPATILLVNQGGEPLTPGLLPMDLRGVEQAGRLTATADPVLRYCGGSVPAEWPLPKALWLKEREPDLWRRAILLVDAAGWLIWRLTGVWTLGLCSAVCRWHYQPHRGWPVSMLNAGGLGDLIARLPRAVLPMGDAAGMLTPEAAQMLGLTTAATVSLSGIDSYAAMVGINALQQGTLALITGASSCQITLWDEPAFDPGIWGPFESAVLPGAWALEAMQPGTGSTVRWLTDLMDGTALGVPAVGNRHVHIDQQAAGVPPGAEGLTLLDHWQGSCSPIRDGGACGAITGLTPAHGPGHLLRAAYEGTAYGNRRILAQLADIGVPIARIVACGGGTRSALWLQILADVAGVPIEVTAVPDAAALGSACCAAVGAGAYADLPSAATAMVARTGAIQPDERVQDTYDRSYSRYIATYEALHRVRVEHPQ
jgi:FGGY-family pentulose kinase